MFTKRNKLFASSDKTSVAYLYPGKVVSVAKLLNLYSI